MSLPERAIIGLAAVPVVVAVVNWPGVDWAKVLFLFVAVFGLMLGLVMLALALFGPWLMRAINDLSKPTGEMGE